MFSRSHHTHLRFLLLTLAILAGTATHASSSGADIANLMRGMFTGLALLGQASNTQGLGYGYPGLPGSPLGGSPWGAAPFGSVPWSGIPWANPNLPGYSQWNNGYPGYGDYRRSPQPLRFLQGGWETHSGGLLLVKSNLARLYVSRDRYQDLEIYADRHYVWMRPAGTRQRADRYDYRVNDGGIVLRDRDGRVLVLRRHYADHRVEPGPQPEPDYRGRYRPNYR